MKKKNQHIIPVCYLKNFVSIEIPSKYKDIKGFQPSVYVNNKELSKWHMKGLRNKIFTSNYYYDMDTKNSIDNDQFIENYFTEFESQYNIILHKIINRETINNNDYHNFIHFLYLLMARNKKQQSIFEKNILLLEKSFSISSKINDFCEKAIARSVIINTNITEKLKNLGFQFIKNKTSIPFITSDCPYSPHYTLKDRKEYQVFFFPLTPNFALITNPYPSESTYIEINDNEEVKRINNNIFNASYEYIISNIEYPLEYLSKETNLNKGLFKTSNNVYHIDIDEVNYVDKSLIFKIKNKNVIEQLIGEDLIELRYCLENGGETVLRSIKLTDYSLINLTFKLEDKYGIGLFNY